MLENQTKKKLRAGQTVFGCFSRCLDAGFTEMLALQGWDFLVFDGEHGTLQPKDCEQLTRAAELRGVTPLVRVPSNDRPTIGRFLDTGAHGVHVPLVNSPAEARAAVESVKYLPQGIRGLAAVRAADFAQKVPVGEYVPFANEQTLVVLQAESGEAAERLPEILKVDGIDVVFIGPTDLSNSLGRPGEVEHPDVQNAITRIAECVIPSSAALGIMVSNSGAARQWQQRGARYITVTLEMMVRSACQSHLSKSRQS